MSVQGNAAARWFKRVTWLGIAANLALALPTLVATELMLRLTRLPTPDPLMWTRFSALLLILLSAFYVPAAIDPYRYRPVAWLAVLSRLAGVVFFVLLQPAEYRMFGYFDLVFLVPEAALLAAMGPAARATPGALATQSADARGRLA